MNSLDNLRGGGYSGYWRFLFSSVRRRKKGRGFSRDGGIAYGNQKQSRLLARHEKTTTKMARARQSPYPQQNIVLTSALFLYDSDWNGNRTVGGGGATRNGDTSDPNAAVDVYGYQTGNVKAIWATTNNVSFQGPATGSTQDTTKMLMGKIGCQLNGAGGGSDEVIITSASQATVTLTNTSRTGIAKDLIDGTRDDVFVETIYQNGTADDLVLTLKVRDNSQPTETWVSLGVETHPKHSQCGRWTWWDNFPRSYVDPAMPKKYHFKIEATKETGGALVQTLTFDLNQPA